MHVLATPGTLRTHTVGSLGAPPAAPRLLALLGLPVPVSPLSRPDPLVLGALGRPAYLGTGWRASLVCRNISLPKVKNLPITFIVCTALVLR